MSDYPSAYDQFIKKVPGVDEVEVDDINDICSAIEKIERTLGLNPQNSALPSISATTIKQRLDAIEQYLSSDSIIALTQSLQAHIANSFENNGITTACTMTSTAEVPFNVSSTALNENLNADLLDGYHATDLLDAVAYHSQPDYDSGWFHIEEGAEYVLDHNLGVEPLLYSFLISDEENPNSVTSYYNIKYAAKAFTGAISVTNITRKQITIKVGSWYSPVDGSTKSAGSGRLLIWKGAPYRGMAPTYDSDWFSVSDGNTYTITHNLATQFKLFQVFYRTDGSTYTFATSNGSAAEQGVAIYDIGYNSFKVKVSAWYDPDNNLKTSGEIRVIAWAGDSLPIWQSTTCNMTIHIDQTYAGNDSDGTIDKPYKTFNEAWAALPNTIAHNVTIVIHGTYAITTDVYLDDDGRTSLIYINRKNITNDGSINIVGDGGTTINCFSDPFDTSSPPGVDYAININGAVNVTISNLEIIGYRYHAVNITEGASVDLSNIRVLSPGNITPPTITTDNEEEYAAVKMSASTVVVDNITVEGAYGSGIAALDNARCEIRDSTLENCGGSGIFLTNSLSLSIGGCDIHDNALYGLSIDALGELFSSNIYNNGAGGIWVRAGKLFASNCDIYNNGGSGAYCTANASLIMRNCHSSAPNNQYGTWARTGSQVKIEYSAGTTNWLKGDLGDNADDPGEYSKILLFEI